MSSTILALALALAPHPLARDRELTALDIYDRMQAVYRDCASYRDSGVVRTVFHSERGKRTDDRPFTLAFVRPDRLRFEFLQRRGEDELDRYLVWREGSEVRVWWDVTPGVETPPSLGDALRAAAGVSGLSSEIVPGLLLPTEVQPWHLPGLGGLERVADADIDATPCHRITGEWDASVPPERFTLWIERDSGLLRRVESGNAFDDFRTETTIDFRPEIDVTIDAAALAFDPPDPEEPPRALGLLDLAPALTPPFDGTPDDLIARMERVYAECSRYRDTGSVRTVFHTERGKRTDSRPFSTAFVRPDRFRFEFTDRAGEEEVRRHIVWRRGEEIRTWWGHEGEGDSRYTLLHALAGATGISGGSARTIPSLLMPEEMSTWRFQPPEELQALDDAHIGPALCHRVRGVPSRSEHPQVLVLWIDAESSLLRRIEQQVQFPEFWTDSVTDYRPQLDVSVDEAALAFDAPEAPR